MTCPGRPGRSPPARMPSRTSRSSAFAPARAKPTGRPCRVHDQVQPQPPEPARVGGAVPVLRPSGQLRAPDRFPGAGALDRGGVHDPDVVGPQAGAGGQDPGAVPDQAPGGPQPLVVTGLLRQVREQVPQVSAGVPDPAGLGGEPEQGLHDRQGDQLGIAELQGPARSRPARGQVRRFLQQVIGSHVQCGSEGVQVCRHKRILDTLVPSAQASPGITRLGPRPARGRDPKTCLTTRRRLLTQAPAGLFLSPEIGPAMCRPPRPA